MGNRDLFEQAIAEARSVREAAIVNAKEALEEKLTPHLKEMLAAKLEEMDQEETNESILKTAKNVTEAEDSSEEGELEANEEGNEEEDAQDLPEPEEEGEEDLDDEDLGDLSVEEFKEIIRDIIAQEIGAQGEEIPGEEIPGEEIPGEEIPGEEIPGEVPMDGEINAPEEEEIDLDELLRELEASENTQPVRMKEYTTPRMKEPSDAAAGGAENLIRMLKNAVEKAPEIKARVQQALGLGGSPSTLRENALRTEISNTKKQLANANKAIKVLTENLEEVNLLNAKLLYVNKVLKPENKLTESQQVNIIAAFDKAETPKEARLVYETVVESIGVKRKAPLRESRGAASNPIRGTKKPDIITESAAIRRMQKLAGIIKD